MTRAMGVMESLRTATKAVDAEADLLTAVQHADESCARFVFGETERGHRGWRAARSSIITSSDVPSILGLPGARQSLFSVWVAKIQALEALDSTPQGRDFRSYIESTTREDREELRWGRILEAPIADEVASRLGLRFIDHGRNTIFVNAALPVPLGFSPDRIIESPKDATLTLPADRSQPGRLEWKAPRPGVYEGKTIGAYGDRDGEWSIDGPVRDQAQLQVGLAVTGFSWGILAGLQGSPTFRLAGPFVHKRDDAFISFMLERMVRFWEYVTKREPPPVDGSESTARALSALYAKGDPSKTVDLGLMGGIWAKELAEAKRQEKAAKQRQREVSNAVRQAMGDATVGYVDGMACGFTLRDVAESTYTTTRAAHRRLCATGEAED